MSKKYKMDMSRPEFLDLFIEEYTETEIGKVIPSQSNLIYTMYTVILESDLARSNIESVSYDEETVVVKFKNKSTAKEVRDRYKKETIRLGYDIYQIDIKVDKAYLYISLNHIKSINDEEEDE